MTSRFAAASLAGALLLAASPARAGDVAAEALFQEGKKLSDAGDWAGACPKFEESNRIEPKVGTLYRYAECLVKVGRTATAWEAFTEVASKSKTEGNREREKFARDRAKELEPLLVRLKIEVRDKPEGLVVKRGGVVIGGAQLGVAIPVDPGKITLSASAPGRQTWTGAIDAVKEGETVVIVIPPLEPGAGPEPGPAPYGAGPPPPYGGAYPYGPPYGRPADAWTRRSPGLWAGGGVLIGLGTVFTLGGIAAFFTIDDAAPGASLTVLGLAMVGGGIPMVVVGSQKVPLQPPPGMQPRPVASPWPELRVGVGQASATWTF